MRSKLSALFSVAAAVAMISALATPAAQAIQLDDKEIYIEINDTDGDAGIHVFLDGEGWEKMQLLDPDGRVLFDLDALRSAQIQGLTELFIESAEPSFEDQPLDEFLALWPEGDYRFRGRTNEGVPLRGKATLTHDIPAAPILVRPVEGDEEVDPEDTVIEWMPVADPPGSEIVSYEVIVETEDDEAANEDFNLVVGPETTSVTVAPEFMEPGIAYKFEVIAKEESGNQTISEREFETADDDDD